MRTAKTGRMCLALLFLTAIGISFAGCSARPSEPAGRRAVENLIDQQSEGRIAMETFQKTNGAEGEANGVKSYSMDFEAKIKFNEDCKWSTGFSPSDITFHTYKNSPKTGSPLNLMENALSGPGTMVRKGQEVKLEGAIRFIKKESGWVADDIAIKSVAKF